MADPQPERMVPGTVAQRGCCVDAAVYCYRGSYQKPSIVDILWLQLVLLPYHIIRYVAWYLHWIWKYTIMRHEYDDDARCYIIRRNLRMSQRQWEVYTLCVHDDRFVKDTQRKLCDCQNVFSQPRCVPFLSATNSVKLLLNCIMMIDSYQDNIVFIFLYFCDKLTIIMWGVKDVSLLLSNILHFSTARRGMRSRFSDNR